MSQLPVLDLPRPSTLIEPSEGVLFSTQYGADTDRDVALSRNQTNYTIMKGNNIDCTATSDDSIAYLRLDPAGTIELSNVILPAVAADSY